jgi:hypothetical protein
MSYISEHPTNFNWTSPVKKRVLSVQRKWPWETFLNTYLWHPPYAPPYITRRYDQVSFDVWNGGGYNASTYSGYRGKPLPPDLGRKIFNHLFYTNHGPPIAWIIYRGRMWVRGVGWGPAPGGPPDSDPGHYNHIHVTYQG